MKQFQKTKVTNELTEAVSLVIKMMRSDFPQQFKKAFQDDEALNDFKNRIYARAKKSNILGDILISAYDDLIDENVHFMPSGNDILTRAKESKKKISKETAENVRIAELNELEGKEVTCNPVKLLNDAMSASSAKKYEGSRLDRLKLAVLNNNMLTASISRRYANEYHQCNYNGCRNAGSMTSSTTGSDSWYCSKHSRLT
ncbi:MAG: hypothetical protein GQ532_02320 [Methylomarinum sp.]|nr:hypothetical protein [Methylomarinum sp.]